MSGKLWNGVLVMYDRATESFWTQIDGRAIVGERSGERLEYVPSVYTTWEQWLAEHPDTLVLTKDGEEKELMASNYADYFDSERLFLPELAEGLGGVEPKSIVFGVRADEMTAAVTEDLLAAAGVVNGMVGTRPVVWVYEHGFGSARAYERLLHGRVVVLTADPTTSSGWRDSLSGGAVALDDLPALRVDRAYWYAWKRSHPASLAIAN